MKGKLFHNFYTRRSSSKVLRYFLIVFRNDSYVKFLTKGDGNPIDGRGLYPPGQLWLEKKDLIGKVKGYASYLCFITQFYSRSVFRYCPYLGIVMTTMTDLFRLNLPISITIGFFVLIYRRWRRMIS
jgi:signal peptidase